MLGLKLSTDLQWANIAEKNIDEILTDHAWCEQKAATNALSLIINNPNYPEMVSELITIVKEEVAHFEMVHNLILERGGTLGIERRDNYVNELYKFMNKGGSRLQSLVDRLLFSAMIEARSCERFRVLSENIKDEKLSKFYRGLMESEAGHYSIFIGFARKYGVNIDVDKRWNQWLEYEATVIANYGKKESIHG